MSLNDQERATLVALQLEKSHKHLKQADEMCNLGYFDLAANRYYYACFHGLQALLINNGMFCHTHAGLIAAFGKNFVKPGLIDASFGRFVSRLEQLRQKGDYNCNYEVEKEDVNDMVQPCHELISIIEKMINEQDALD